MSNASMKVVSLHPESDHQSFEQRLGAHPELKAKFENLLDIVENSDGSLDRASDAELKTIEVVRQIGQETLKNWAHSQERKKAAQLRKVNPAAQQDKKKTLLA